MGLEDLFAMNPSLPPSERGTREEPTDTTQEEEYRRGDEQYRVHQGYTVEGAARALGVRPVTVRGAIREGKLRATKLGRQFLITKAAVEEYQRDHLGRKGWVVRRSKTNEEDEKGTSS